MGRERTGSPTREELVDVLEGLADAVDAHAVLWANADGIDALIDALELAQDVVDRARSHEREQVSRGALRLLVPGDDDGETS